MCPERRIKGLFGQLVYIFMLDGFVVARREQDNHSRTEWLQVGKEVYIAFALEVVGQVSQE